MARRSRYRELEDKLIKILIADAVVFVLYMVMAGMGLTAMKVITAIVAILASLLCLGFLHISGETARRRSLWLVTGFGGIGICTLLSLLLNFPSPGIQ